MNAPQRFFFVHLQKTAGTALFRRLKRHFGELAIYPGPGDGRPPNSVLLVEHLLERWRLRRDELRVITGHFPLCTTDVLDAPFTTLTVVREPVERTLSYLRHHRKLTPGADDVPLQKIYEEPIRFHGLVQNHMVKMFSLTPDEMIAGAMTHITFTRDHLERAKERLAGLDAFGLQDRFEEFCEELSTRFGWQLGAAVRANRTEPVAVDEAFRARIALDNALDVELYEFARSIYAKRDLVR
jgi:hypothetical protein